MKRVLQTLAAGLVGVSLAAAALPSAALANDHDFSSITVDARTGAVLFSDDADGARYPASLTKMMTLYVLFQDMKSGKVSRDTTFKVSARASHMAPSNLNLKAGATITVDQAIKALVTKSANDVAATIAENLGGSESDFADRMTRVAHSIGMSRTVFANASGLPNSDQHTTARDMATLGLRLMRDFPQYYPYFRITAFDFHGRTIRTHNRLVQFYPGTDGIKTGYIADAGYNLVTSTRRGDKRLVGVVLGASSDASRSRYMRKMLDSHFDEAKGGDTIAALAGSSKGVINPIDGATDLAAKSDAGGDGKLAKKELAAAAAEATATLTPASDEPATLANAIGDGWKIAIGKFASKAEAETKLVELRSKAETALENSDDLAVKLKGDSQWSALYEGLDKGEASRACAALKKLGANCSVIGPAA